MNKTQIKSQPHNNVIVWLVLVIVAFISIYGLWNAIIAIQTADRATEFILEINSTDSKHKQAILDLQKCYNDKVATCTIDLR